jgi:F-type H+-transporting ATPase subunit b
MFSTPEFWVAIAFIILVVGLARPFGRAVAAGLDSRSDKIRHALDAAAGLREEAQRLLVEYQRRQRDAAKECAGIVAQAETEAARFAEQATARLTASLQRREQLAIDKIAQAETDATQQVRDATVDIAVAATRKLLAGRLDAAAGGRLIDQAIEELPGKLH